MVKKLNINDVRVIVDLFNKKHGFNLVETKTPPKQVSYFYPYPYIIIDTRYISQNDETITVGVVRVLWDSINAKHFLDFTCSKERELLEPVDVYEKKLVKKMNTSINLYRLL